MRHYRASLVLALASFVAFQTLAAETAESTSGIPISELKRTDAVDFEKEILPVLKNNCLACHNQTKAKSDLVLETPQTIAKGGESGPAMVPGKSSESLLLKVAAHLDKPFMPPKENKVNASDLTPDQLALIKLWIDQGGKGEVHGSGPIVWQPIPETAHPIWAIALSPDGQFAACGRGNQLFIYHLPTQTLTARLSDPGLTQNGSTLPSAHLDFVQSLAFSPDGELLASGSYREVKLWRRPHDAFSDPVPTLAADRFRTVATSPDGRWFALGDESGQIQICHAVEPKSAKTLTGHDKAIVSLKFSPDGHRLLSTSVDLTLRVWDVAQAKQIAFARVATNITATAWIQQGKGLASANAEKAIQLWTVPHSGEELTAGKVLKGHQEAIIALEDGGKDDLLSASRDGTIRLWKLETGEQVKSFEHGGPVTALAGYPKRRQFASSGENGITRLWNLEEGKVVREFKGEYRTIETLTEKEHSLAYAKTQLDYRKAAVESSDKERKAQVDRVRKASDALGAAEAAAAEKQKALTEAKTAVDTAEKGLTDVVNELKKAKETSDTAIAASDKAKTDAKQALKPGDNKAPDAALAEKAIEDVAAKASAAALAKANFERLQPEIEKRKKQAEEKLASVKKPFAEAENALKKPEIVRTAAENELNISIASAQKASDALSTAQSAFQLAETEQKNAESALSGAQQAFKQSVHPVRSIAFSSDGMVVATSTDDALVHLWSAESGLPLDTLHAGKECATALAFENETDLIAVAGQKALSWGFHSSWKLDRGIGSGNDASPLIDRVNALCFTPDGQELVTGGGDPSRSGEVKVWQVATGTLVREFKNLHSDVVFGLDFTPDGRYLASGGADRFVRITDMSNGKLLRSLEGHTDHVMSVAWKRDGHTLISGGADKMAKVWEALAGERKKNIEGFGKEVTSVCFLGDTDQALACSGDNSVRLVKEGGDNVRTFEGAKDFMQAAAATYDGNIVAAGGQDGVLYIWNGKTGKLVCALSPGSLENR